MKRIIVGIIAASMAICSFSATLEENINNKNYAAACKQLEFSTNTLNYVKTSAQAAACYEAAIAATNYIAACCAAHIALWYRDKMTFQRFLDFCMTINATTKYNALYIVQPYKQSIFDSKTTGRGRIKVFIYGKETSMEQSLNMLYPDMMLAWYKKLAAAGKWEFVALAAQQVNINIDADNNVHYNILANWIDNEWKTVLDSFTPEIVENLQDARSISAVLQYAYSKDCTVNDINRTACTHLMTANVIKQYAKLYKTNTNHMPIFLGTRDIYAKTMIQYCDIVQQKIFWAQKLDKWYNTKNNVKQIFPLVLASNDLNWNQKAAIALDIGDKDIIIDTFLVIGTDADAKNIEAVIPTLNGLDVGYRTADVKKILATINKKYTLKLYNDRDVWEPILSKIRAMLEVIE